MAHRFTALAISADVEPDHVEAGVSELADGSGFVVLFQCGADEPDAQDAELGMDTYCVVTADQGTAYGCVRAAELTGNVLRVTFDPAALPALGLDDAELEAVLEAPAEDVARFGEVLGQVLDYGREDVRVELRPGLPFRAGAPRR
ncbi:hypothetical protein LZ318_16920 [Saccharopolyspora indica]|uniref:Imm10 family immunity protein n=1 Tax=Saccharopolyspora indica TaxID=1229659 RepID=UPI0022EA9706|nr:Imm10 family immunity protein [Saccharopolyspora indica]MDA3648637.1 Imm10 family immunity protein [Saccharopolyspora indica]